ncbi:MAG TPA: DUF1521 domain-containing protein [Pyrinomonadaceae bacterium]|nr:DUF1521 domain-containing protein [Pyrinomonadaceae bacterium]
MTCIPGTFNQSDIFGDIFSQFSNASLNPEAASLLEAAGQFLEAAGNFLSEMAQMGGAQNLNDSPFNTCCPVSEPDPADSTHPAGSLTAEGDVITTPGGYKIEMVGQYEWKITGPDGKTTRVWGDPHVDEGDRDGANDWEFKRNSTFVLGDGTRINVTTAPFGSGGATVTSSLEVISGNDRVVVSDIDKGKGNIGTVTQDGYQHANGFDGDVFVMGREADDWSYTGKEILGSENGGDSFKLGGELHPLGSDPVRFDRGFDWVSSLFDNFTSHMRDAFGTARNNSKPTRRPPVWESAYGDDRARQFRAMADVFDALGKMFDALARLSSLSEQLSAGRYNGRYNIMA